MNPGVEEAWIAAGVGALGIISTAFVAAVNARNAKQTAIATINAGHDARVWEKQSAAYEDAVKEVLARRIRREALTSRGDVGNIGSHPVEELRRAEEPEIIRIRAALRPYASNEVWRAYQNANDANDAFWVSLGKLQAAHLVGEGRADYGGALDAMNQAKADACAADDAFFDVVNTDLTGGPDCSAAPGPAARRRP